MSDTKWTPEELRITRGAGADAFSIEGATRTIAHVKPVRHADKYAALFAAAPDLYEALEAMVQEIRYLQDDGTLPPEAIAHPTIVQALAALAKARGEG